MVTGCWFISDQEQHPFVRSKCPSLRPDLPSGKAPRAAAVKDAARKLRHRRSRRAASLTERARCSAERVGDQAARRSASFLVPAKISFFRGAWFWEPVLVGLDGEPPPQPQATLTIGEDAHDPRATL